MRHSPASLFSAASLLTLSLLGGCAMPGGAGYSGDRFCYVSDSFSPKTISLIDTRTRQVVWSTEIPVGQQLVITFLEGTDPAANMPDVMRYGFTKAGRWSASTQSSIPVPGEESRRVDCTIRTAPEFAPGVVAPAAAPGPVSPSQPTATTSTPATPIEKSSPSPKQEMIDLPETEAPKADPASDPK